MVATPEPFKALAKKIQKKNINEEDAKLLIAEYETEYGLDQVPAKALRGVIRTCRNKGAQLLGDPALEPAFVLKQWMGLEIDPPMHEEGVRNQSQREMVFRRRSRAMRNPGTRSRRNEIPNQKRILASGTATRAERARLLAGPLQTFFPPCKMD